MKYFFKEAVKFIAVVALLYGLVVFVIILPANAAEVNEEGQVCRVTSEPSDWPSHCPTGFITSEASSVYSCGEVIRTVVAHVDNPAEHAFDAIFELVLMTGDGEVLSGVYATVSPGYSDEIVIEVSEPGDYLVQLNGPNLTGEETEEFMMYDASVVFSIPEPDEACLSMDAATAELPHTGPDASWVRPLFIVAVVLVLAGSAVLSTTIPYCRRRE